MSPASAEATSTSPRHVISISAILRYLSSVKITCAPVQRLVTRSIRIIPASVKALRLGVMAVRRPVYSIFINSSSNLFVWMRSLLTALVSARNLHVFAVFGNRASCDLDALPLKLGGKILIGPRLARVFLFNQLLHAALHKQQ